MFIWVKFIFIILIWNIYKYFKLLYIKVCVGVFYFVYDLVIYVFVVNCFDYYNVRINFIIISVVLRMYVEKVNIVEFIGVLL